MKLGEFLANARAALRFGDSDASEARTPYDVLTNQIGHIVLGGSAAYILTANGVLLSAALVWWVALAWEAYQAATDGQWALVRRRWDGVADWTAFGMGGLIAAHADAIPSWSGPLAAGLWALALAGLLGRK